jgi:hypothetical protein
MRSWKIIVPFREHGWRGVLFFSGGMENSGERAVDKKQ